MHQINQDGAGPYLCDIAPDGAKFMAMEVTRNVPGVASLSLATVADIPLVVRVPKNMNACTGGSNGATCIIRCRNTAVAGPFGGCMPVVMDEAPATAPVASTPSATPSAAVKQALVRSLIARRSFLDEVNDKIYENDDEADEDIGPLKYSSSDMSAELQVEDDEYLE